MSYFDIDSTSFKALSTFLVIGIGVFSFRRFNQRKNFIKYMQPNITYTVIPASRKVSSKRTVLVTGGEGFVGKYIVNLLLKDGCRVVVFDIVIPNENARIPEVSNNI